MAATHETLHWSVLRYEEGLQKEWKEHPASTPAGDGKSQPQPRPSPSLPSLANPTIGQSRMRLMLRRKAVPSHTASSTLPAFSLASACDLFRCNACLIRYVRNELPAGMCAGAGHWAGGLDIGREGLLGGYPMLRNLSVRPMGRLAGTR
jgi:hypothetical protein